MMDTAGLNALGNLIVQINRDNGWKVAVPEDWNGDTYKIPALLALIHSETSEALEAFREHDRNNFEEEIADTIIRCLDLSAGLGIDIEKAIQEKLEHNKARGYRHGGKRV